MAKYRIGDLLVCYSGPDEDILTLGYIMEMTGKHVLKYGVQWVDDEEGDLKFYQEETIGVFENLMLESCNENAIQTG